jgi:CAAX protease family protein
VAFILTAAAGLAFAVFAGAMVFGSMGPVRPIAGMALVSAIASTAMLLVTLGLLRQEGIAGAALGLPVNRRRVREFAIGFVVSVALFLAIAWTQSAMVGAAWVFQGAHGALAAARDLPLIASMVLAEELLFRGAALRYLRELFGDRRAIALSALCFGAYHLVGTQYWGMGAVFQFLMPTLGGLLFGWAAVRTNGLALPLALHLGGNWVQASVAAFRPLSAGSATDVVSELWRIPIGPSEAQLLSAPDLLPRLPFMLAVALAAVMTRQLLHLFERPAVRTI